MKKINKRQLKRIIREERLRLLEFGHDRRRAPLDLAALEKVAESHAGVIGEWLEAYAGFDDPRAEQIDELIFQLYGRLRAVIEGRE